jgi:hypothetical protein
VSTAVEIFETKQNRILNLRYPMDPAIIIIILELEMKFMEGNCSCSHIVAKHECFCELTWLIGQVGGQIVR